MSYIRTLAVLVILVGTLPLRAEVWPFDQRQVLLVQIEGTDFPDALTTAQVLDVFVERGRVRWITLQGSPSSLAPVFVPKDFPWNRSASVRELGLRYKADGIVVLGSKGAQVDLRWYAVSDGQPLYFESLYLPASSGSVGQDAERKKRLRDWLGDLWNRIPGQGYVVKRDIATLDIEGAANEALKVGDQISLLRLKDIKRHPVLKTLVGFESTQTGTATITALGKPFSVARVDYESDLDPIHEGDRYLRKEKDKNVVPGVETTAAPVVPTDNSSDSLFASLGEQHIFDISPRIGVGFLSYEERIAGQVYKMKTFSLSYGLRADLYLTSAWYAAFQFDQGGAKYGTPPTDYAATDLSSGWSNTHIFSGYRMPLSDYSGGEGDTELDFFGGYSRFGFKAEQLSSAVAPSAKTYSGLDFGMAVHIPIQAKFVSEVGFTRMLGAFLKEDSLTSGSASSNSAWSFWAKLRILAEAHSEFGGAYEVYQGSSSFEGTGTRATPALSAKATSQRTAFYYKQMF